MSGSALHGWNPGKAFMPTEAGGLEAIKCIEDDEDVSFQVIEFRAYNDIDLFLHFHLKVCIANVCFPNIKVIKLRKEEKR